MLIYGPLAHGFRPAPGTFTPQTSFAADDWRNKSEIFHGKNFQRNLAVVEHLKQLAEQEGMTVAQLAIAWGLAQPAIDVAIVEHANPTKLINTRSGSEISILLKQHCARSSALCARQFLLEDLLRKECRLCPAERGSLLSLPLLIGRVTLFMRAFTERRARS